MASFLRPPVVVGACAVGIALAACSPPNQIDSDTKIDTATSVAAPSSAPSSTSSSAAPTSSMSAAPSTSAAAAAVEVDVSTTENVAEGEELTINIRGLNPQSGYYTAICAANSPAGPPPACTGEFTDASTAAWINSLGTGTVALQDDGSATVVITAASRGDNIDCHAQECVVKVFGDHTEGFRPVTEVPITFAG